MEINCGSAIFCLSCTYPINEKVWSETLQKLVPTGNKIAKHLMLGSITPECLLYAKLYKNGVVIVSEGTIALACQCGYTVDVDLTNLRQTAGNQAYAD